MFKLKTRNLAPLAILVFTITIFISVLIIKAKILDFLRLPLIISSSFISDVKGIFTYKFIIDENTKLRKQVDALKKDTIIINELRIENERLKRLLFLKEKYQFNTVVAKVIAQDPNNWSSGIVINKGRRQGITSADIAITDLGLVGRLIEVSADTSKILLINDPNNSVAAVIQRSRVEGIASGTLLGGLVMRYLDKDADVAVGDAVLTSGLTKNYPAALLVGQVKSVEDEQSGLGKYCVISPAVNLNKLEEVLVITGRQ